MATQQAIVVTEIGKPSILVDNHPIPRPGKGQIQIKVSIAGLNPHDQKARDFGLFIKDFLPAVGANDVVGTVSELGEGVTDFAIGDRVVSQGGFAPGWSQQGLQEYAVEDAAFSCKIPKGLSDDDAATLPTNLIAGVAALFASLNIEAPWIKPGQTTSYKHSSILIVGGGSNCGRFGVQLAKLAGFGTILVVGGLADQLKDLGATEVIDRHLGEDKIVQRIRHIVGDDLIYAYDTVNPPSGQTLAVKALSNKKRGTLVRLLSRLQGDTQDLANLPGKEAGTEIKDVIGLSSLHADVCGPFWAALPEYLKNDTIRPTSYTVLKGLTADNVNAILDGYRDSKAMTKTHIHF